MTLSKIAQALDDARRDVALLQRLQNAEARERELAAAYDAAKAEEERSAIAEAAKAEEDMMKGITDIHVRSANPDENIVRQTFIITYTRTEYDMYAKRALPRQFEVRGFRAVPEAVMLYLVKKRPNRIPADIVALAPGDPHRALSRYFSALHRGFLAS